MTSQYNQGAAMYNNNINTAIQIPSLLFSTQSNSYQDINVPASNIIKISTNLATSMTKMANFTTTINEINQSITNAVAVWNSTYSPQPPLSVQSLLPSINETVNYFENGNQVMDFNIFTHLFFSNGNKRSQPNYYYSNVASLNTNALTYANGVSNYNSVCLSNLVTDQYCTNNNIGLSSVNGSILIDLNNNLKHYTNLNNLIGSYHCLDVESLYNSFVGFGYVKYNLDYSNNSDIPPNVYGGVLVQLINRYNIYVPIPNIATPTPTTTTTTTTTTTPTITTTPTTPGSDIYQIQLDVSYLVYFYNLVSQSQLNTNLSQSSGSGNGTTAAGLTVPSTQQVASGVVPTGYIQ